MLNFVVKRTGTIYTKRQCGKSKNCTQMLLCVQIKVGGMQKLHGWNRASTTKLAFSFIRKRHNCELVLSKSQPTHTGNI